MVAIQFRCNARSRLEWESGVVLISLGRWLTYECSTIALALAQELDGAGLDLKAGLALAVVTLETGGFQVL